MYQKLKCRDAKMNIVSQRLTLTADFPYTFMGTPTRYTWSACKWQLLGKSPHTSSQRGIGEKNKYKLSTHYNNMTHNVCKGGEKRVNIG